MENVRCIVEKTCGLIEVFNNIVTTYPHASIEQALLTSKPAIECTEEILNTIESNVNILSSDEMVAQYPEDEREEFISWLQMIQLFISKNKGNLQQSSDGLWIQSQLGGWV